MSTLRTIEPAISETAEVWPALANVLQEQGFEAGYCRGVNDALLAMLEGTEDFVSGREDADATRLLLYAFSEFLENRVRRSSSALGPDFIDGAGI